MAAAIRTRFPVAMIDEFGDSAPSSTNFSPYLAPSAGNRIVADWRPKQAIYAFRGADIFTYMKARSEVHAHYTLDTNWRSAPGMVNSVNKLFQPD
ncbi:UvrD-helicase domain-containing protein [Escherichia coli]